MRKFVFCALLLSVSVSFGQPDSNGTNIESFLVKRALNSLVKVTLVGTSNRIEMPGLITKDPKGNLQVLTGFPVFNWFVESGHPIVIVNGAGRRFPVEGIRRITPLYSLIALSVKGDLTEQGRFPPVEVAQSFNENEPLFYTVPDNSWFKVKRVQKILSFPKRLDFFTESSLDVLSPQPIGGIFIINQKGEVVSFVETGSDMVLFGLPLDILRSFLRLPIADDVSVIHSAVSSEEHMSNLMSSNLSYLKPFILSFPTETCSHFLRGCLAKARQVLYRQVQEGDSQDRYQLLSFVSAQFPTFEEFMRSVGISDSSRISEEWEVFLKSSALWDPIYYLQKKIEATQTSGKQSLNHLSIKAADNILFFPLRDKVSLDGDTELKEYLQFLTQKGDVRDLALKGHPHFQYMMGVMHFETGDMHSALDWLNKSSENGYLPGLFAKSVSSIIVSIQALLKLAEDSNFSLAKKMMGVLSQDLNKAEDFLEQYNTDQVSPRFPKSGYFKRFLRWWRVVFSRDASTVEEEIQRTTYENSVMFNGNLSELTIGLKGLRSAAEQGYEPAKQLLSNFEEQLRVQVPIYPLSEELNQECLNTFKTYFTSPKRKNL